MLPRVYRKFFTYHVDHLGRRCHSGLPEAQEMTEESKLWYGQTRDLQWRRHEMTLETDEYESQLLLLAAGVKAVLANVARHKAARRRCRRLV